MGRVADEIRALLSLVTAERVPSADDVRAHVKGRGADLMVAGPTLFKPTWAIAVSGADDVFAALKDEADVVGMRITKDPRGWGTDIEMVLRGGTVADIETVTGPTRRMPRRKPEYALAFASVNVEAHRISVHVHHTEGQARIVQLHFGSDSQIPSANAS